MLILALLIQVFLEKIFIEKKNKAIKIAKGD